MSHRFWILGAAAALSVSAASVVGCGERDDVWETTLDQRPPLAIRGAAAVLDPNAERVIFLPVEGDLSIRPVAIPVGKNIPVPGAAVTDDGLRLAVLSRGDLPRRSAKDQGPALHLMGGEPPTLQARYELSDPLSRLTLDPASRYAIVSASLDDVSFVTNPNELIIADLSAPPSASNPVAVTLRSFGGRPERLDFTPPLELPSGKKRLLVAQTDRDVALLDLEDPRGVEITVRLTGSSTRLEPAGLAVSDGEPGKNDDARLAIRLARDPDVILVDLLPPTDEAAQSGAPFRPTPNIVGVGGIASDVAFVRTDGGLRLAALVPSRRELVLVEPATGTTSALGLEVAFQRIALVTEEAGESDETALLWSDSQAAIAFVSLGQTAGKPHKSIEVLPLPEPIGQVLPVPAPFQRRKVLVSAGGRNFYVLDLPSRTIAPLSSTGAQLSISPDGRRAWAFRAGQSNLAAVDLESAHPQNLLLDLPISGVADVVRRDGGRALVAIHPAGGLSVSVLDAASPSLLTLRMQSSLSLEGLP